MNHHTSIAGNAIFQDYGTTIFTTMSELGAEFGAVNLGQGFPDDNGPDDVRKVAAEALLNGDNQYPPMLGTPGLRTAVAAHNKRFYGLDIDPRQGVLVTSGATEALAACILGLTNPGDEVIVIEPLYDSYVPIIRRAGAVPKFIRLQPPHWRLDGAALQAAVTSRTRAILFNTPHNPTGAVLSRTELELIADLLHAYPRITAICDEVYEHLLFDGAAHVPLLSLPGMARRALKIGSAGKSFSLTGWKVGYISGDATLIDLVAKAHQFLTFTVPPNLQTAVAYGLAKDHIFFQQLSATLQEKRNTLAAALCDIGFDVLPCAGTYFLSASYTHFTDLPARDFACQLVREAKVVTIPYDPFYGDPDGAPLPKLIRFCFAKQDVLLAQAVTHLRTLVSAVPKNSH
jgi:N-succinyldiaminopimelate aminotransferase